MIVLQKKNAVILSGCKAAREETKNVITTSEVDAMKLINNIPCKYKGRKEYYR